VDKKKQLAMYSKRITGSPLFYKNRLSETKTKSFSQKFAW
jgi:hypothetical protein